MSTLTLNDQQQRLFGLTSSGLVPIDGQLVAKEIDKPLQDLKTAAIKDNIHIEVVSGFRDFDRQLLIWNNKFSGKRPILDDHGQTIDTTKLSDLKKIHAIMRFSALPGTSRHHWGTDIDIIDRNAIKDSYQLKLTPDEYQHGGPFAKLNTWLSQYAGDFGFLRPYSVDTGGVAIEPWHLSYSPISNELTNLWFKQTQLLTKTYQMKDILGKQTIMDNLDKLIPQFVVKPQPVKDQ